MLPLDLLNTAKSHDVAVELKNGETYNGVLINCDNYMNISLKDAILTSKDGDLFWKLDECYIRGNSIKYFRIEPEVIEETESIKATENENSGRGRGRGRGGSRGSGRGSGRGKLHSWKENWGGESKENQ